MSNTADELGGLTSERLHNHNCYAYLKTLKLPESVLENLRTQSPILARKLEKVSKQDKYNPNFPYADLYTQFFDVVEENIKTIFDKKRDDLINERAEIEGRRNFVKECKGKPGYSSIVKNLEARSTLEYEQKIQQQLQDLDDFIFSIYANKNDILEYTFNAIQEIPLQHTPSDPEIEKGISGVLKDVGEPVNKEIQSPREVESAYGRFTAMISANFKPQHTTSLATERSYKYNKNGPVKEYRFGTQGQRHHGIERVSPLFERWLDVQERMHPNENPSKPKITHVYINNLGLDRTDYEGKKESALTRALHGLEERHKNIAVITLPADKGLMDQSEFKKTKDSHNYSDVYNEFLQIANQDPTAKRKIKDFYISDDIRKLLFQDKTGRYTNEIEKAHLERLLNKSFAALGIEKGSPLSSAQRQAVWFHFNKFELTNHIIETLNPESVNFSCKDAIDRGGVSSAYYNLMKSIEKKEPLDREEFERALHAAPTMVKARGMNHHLKLIWNATDAYINANYEKVKNDPKQAWLVEWRDLNCPHARVEELLALRITQAKEELANAKPHHPAQALAINKGQEILTRIEQQSQMGVSGKRLLLETVIRTPELILNPNKPGNAERYVKLADKLSIKYPKLHVLGGLMKSLAGLILYIPTFGHTKEWISKGIATAKAGLESDTRRKAVEHMDELKHMKEQIHDIKSNKTVEEDDDDDDDDDDRERESVHI